MTFIVPYQMVYNNSTKSHLFVKSQIFRLQVILEIIYTNTLVSWMRKIKLIKIYLHSSRKPLCSRVMTRTNFFFSVQLSLDPFSCNLHQILGAIPVQCSLGSEHWIRNQKEEHYQLFLLFLRLRHIPLRMLQVTCSVLLT